MKIIFVSLGTEYIGIELMAAYLKQAGHSIKAICDESVFDDKNYFTVPGLARFFNRRQEVIGQILAEEPDLVGISVITNGFPWALEVAQGVKVRQPDIRIIMGGIHVTSLPEVVIAKDWVDMICVGEGHEAIVELADALEQGQDRTDIPNIWFKRNGRIISNPQRPETQDLDQLYLLDKTVYEGEVPLHQTYLALSQYGCPFACNYCAVSTLAQNSRKLGCKTLRSLSVDKVIGEIAYYRDRYDFDSVFFMTNTFTADKAWVLEWASKYPGKIGLPYKIATHPARMDYDIALALKKSGCYIVQLGVESFSEEVRRKIFNRAETTEQIIAATDAMDRAGLRYTIDYIMGAPLQGEEEYRQAAEFFATRRKCIRVTPFIISFYPSTPIVDIAKKYGWLNDEHIQRLNEGLDPNFVTSGSILDREKVKELNVWRLFFRLIPLLPLPVTRYLLSQDRFKVLRFLPIGTLILFLDVIVSILARDYVALGYLRMYVWNIRKVLKAKLRSTWKKPPSASLSPPASCRVSPS